VVEVFVAPSLVSRWHGRTIERADLLHDAIEETIRR
jgi:hypothetical protein